MSRESVRAFLAERAPDIEIVDLPRSSETHTLAASWNIKPAQIAKTLTLKVGDRNLLVVACGDSRLDSKKVKAVLGGKPKMLPPEAAAALTGHPVGGVCPFGLATPLPVYCDVLLLHYDIVVPGAGSTHAAMRIAPSRMAELAGAEWIDVCESPTDNMGHRRRTVF
jgi:prolyl-tRNA editing enzyme YbaK/EbsC (Cys-tRNA(Pro) deacylase)